MSVADDTLYRLSCGKTSRRRCYSPSCNVYAYSWSLFVVLPWARVASRIQPGPGCPDVWIVSQELRRGFIHQQAQPQAHATAGLLVLGGFLPERPPIGLEATREICPM